jgi:hypothetical protein
MLYMCTSDFRVEIKIIIIDFLIFFHEIYRSTQLTSDVTIDLAEFPYWPTLFWVISLCVRARMSTLTCTLDVSVAVNSCDFFRCLAAKIDGRRCWQAGETETSESFSREKIA